MSGKACQGCSSTFLGLCWKPPISQQKQSHSSKPCFEGIPLCSELLQMSSRETLHLVDSLKIGSPKMVVFHWAPGQHDTLNKKYTYTLTPTPTHTHQPTHACTHEHPPTPIHPMIQTHSANTMPGAASRELQLAETPPPRPRCFTNRLLRV